ncbi:cytidine deaminase [Limimaricola variabilis]|uniref:Cytidine deaminase n=1 Tax=Limimaricola variabilis TaxID=1492771 RepID=A0ABR6HQQ4_9RHOB|nr:cytidine deaminase [Limimaricola variabilis]MBB3712781.1 cytidine deaminase [Limimaricola variabilis]
MDTEQQLYAAAVDLVKRRYPTGWGGAAAVRLESGDIVTSVAPDTDFDALFVCMELSAFLEAHKRDLKVTHSLCLFREDETASFNILSPCGICQERLRFWGTDVLVAVTNPGKELLFRPLADLQAHHWSGAYR